VPADYIILKNGKVVQATQQEWAIWFSTDQRFVANYRHNDVAISTICLGMNHGFDDYPTYFETLAYGGIFDEARTLRYSTLEEAKAGHEELIKEYQRSMPLEFGPDIHSSNRLNLIESS
jgi:hypothetical protein